MATPARLIFLPGAAGRTNFWSPVSNLLTNHADQIHVGWPGFGEVPADPQVKDIDDLVNLVTEKIDRPTALIAQSMGGVIAIRVALKIPHRITHLVLSVTSGGIDVAGLGGIDWRPAIRASNPDLPEWFLTYHDDLSAALPTIRIPTLLLWGDADPISPVAVGQKLQSLLPCAKLQVLPGGDHQLACMQARAVAPLIEQHLLISGNSMEAFSLATENSEELRLI